MIANLDELVSMQGIILTFEFTRDGTRTSYEILLANVEKSKRYFIYSHHIFASSISDH